NELAIHPADTRAANRPRPGNIADHQRGGCTQNGEHIRIVLAISAERNGLNLNFVIPAFGEERTDRTINDAGSENFFFGGTAFTFEITAREFSGRRSFFAVIDRQREEFLS